MERILELGWDREGRKCMALAPIENTPLEKRLNAHNDQVSGFVQIKTVPKPWGREEWLIETDKYVLKRLYVNAGEMLSKQYHEVKMETLILQEGEAIILLGQQGNLNLPDAKEYRMVLGEPVHIMPKTIHTFKAITDVMLYEGSTPELTDVVRLEDKYNRPKTYALEEQLKEAK